MIKIRTGLLINKPDKDISLTESFGIGFIFENFSLDFSYLYNEVLSGYAFASIKFYL